MGFTDPEHETLEPSVPQSHKNIPEQWGAWGWFLKTHQPENPKMSYSASLPPSQTPLRSPQSAASFWAHVYLWFPLLIISFTKAHCVPCSSSQALLGADKTQVESLCRLKFQRKKQCSDFCRDFDNGESNFFKPPLSPLSCSWDFSVFFPLFERVADKILLQELVFRDGSRRRKENIYFLFLLVNQNILFKESALCRIAHELLPLMEIKEKYQEVFLVIPFPCLFFFLLNSLYTHVLANA